MDSEIVFDYVVKLSATLESVILELKHLTD